MGYGNAAGCMIFLTSFLGVIVFRRCVSDVALILIGMLSFASGIFFMSFVKTTSMFYLGKTEHLKTEIQFVICRDSREFNFPKNNSCNFSIDLLYHFLLNSPPIIVNLKMIYFFKIKMHGFTNNFSSRAEKDILCLCGTQAHKNT